jgi:hypothetical protein
VDSNTECRDGVAGGGDAGDACLARGAKRIVSPVKRQARFWVAGIQKKAKGAECHVIGIS